MAKTKLFIDHDGTFTYYDIKHEKWYYKDGVKEFLDFITENFEVYWCSGLGYAEILSGLRNIGIENSVLEKIDYFAYHPYGEKAKSIVQVTNDFIFIDDDGDGDEFRYMKRKGSGDKFIKANSKNAKDLDIITSILKGKLKK